MTTLRAFFANEQLMDTSIQLIIKIFRGVLRTISLLLKLSKATSQPAVNWNTAPFLVSKYNG